MAGSRHISDPMPGLPVAGQAFVADDECVAQCLTADTDPRNERPGTPPHLRKYRQSYREAPGQKFIHLGLHEVPLPPSSYRYGSRTAKGERVGDCLVQETESELGRFLKSQQESIYLSHRTEPLGQPMARGHKVPVASQQEDFRFGKTSTVNAESAKQIIYGRRQGQPKDSGSPGSTQSLDPAWKSMAGSGDPVQSADPRTRQIAGFSAERDISMQLNRGYDWSSPGLDPYSHRFGKVGSSEAGCVSDCLKQITPESTLVSSVRVADFRTATGDVVGKGKAKRDNIAHLPEDYTYGKAPVKLDEAESKRVISGTYTAVQQQPDKDLGVSVRKLVSKPAVPPEALSRAFGVPSIRDDRPKPRFRSIANAQNFGDEVDCKGLLNPHRFASDGLPPDAFTQSRSPDELRQIFARAGTALTDEQFRAVSEEAIKRFGRLSIDAMRAILNDE